MTPYTDWELPVRDTHECFVCGDTIDLSAQVCSRFCMRAMEQLSFLDNLDSMEAQVQSSSNHQSDFAEPSTIPGYNTCAVGVQIVPEQRAEPELRDVVPLNDPEVVPLHRSY